MLIKRAPMFKATEITDQRLYLKRREFITGAAALAFWPFGASDSNAAPASPPQGQPLKATRNEAFVVKDKTTKFESAATYNNFYEFGVNKDDPARLAATLRTRPWSVKVEGEVHKPR